MYTAVLKKHRGLIMLLCSLMLPCSSSDIWIIIFVDNLSFWNRFCKNHLAILKSLMVFCLIQKQIFLCWNLQKWKDDLKILYFIPYGFYCQLFVLGAKASIEKLSVESLIPSVLDSEINVPKGRTVVGLVHSMWRVVILIYVLQLYFGKEISICFLFFRNHVS